MKSYFLIVLSTIYMQYSCEDYCEIVGADTGSTNKSLEQYEDCEVAGILSLFQTDVTDLNYLSNLRKVNKYVEIAHNGSLKSLKGLDNLEYIGDAVYIYGNDVLQSLEGLEKLSSVGKACKDIGDGPVCKIQIKFNSIKDFKGLKNLDYSYIPLELIEKSYEGLEHFVGVKDIKKDNFPGNYVGITASSFEKSVKPFANLKNTNLYIDFCNEEGYFEGAFWESPRPDEIKGNYDFVNDIVSFTNGMKIKNPSMKIGMDLDLASKNFCDETYEPCGECQ